jgi:hypothetical protein
MIEIPGSDTEMIQSIAIPAKEGQSDYGTEACCS